MKNVFIVLLLAIVSLNFVGCSESLTIKNGDVVKPYGLANRDTDMKPNVNYKVCTGNVVWGVVLCETIIAPIYFFGFDLYEPVSEKVVPVVPVVDTTK
jgi:hypothetical protein